MNSIERQVHLASQYLAAAGISFLDKEEDDSHTNLGFNTDGGYLETHPLSDNNDKLILNYKNFNLEWRSNNTSNSFKLEGATHKEVVDWISQMSRSFIDKEYSYEFHYDLPYVVNDDSVFELSNPGTVQELMHLRILAQFILEKVDGDYNLNASIRIWPHHFDTGIYSALPESDVTVGFGLATPDTVCDSHYLYITGYKDGEVLDTSNFDKLSIGEWKSDGFIGAVLNTNHIVESEGVDFFKEAIHHFKNYT